MCATAATPLVTLIHGVEPPGEPVSKWVGSSGDMVPNLGRCVLPRRHSRAAFGIFASQFSETEATSFSHRGK